ncbi:hypothetical protein [Enterococcus sp. AD013-P3]|uniref:hypothetical protein n=1 Tax=Enterococcus sp. AD013-P3 TaxID=3411036 RepID=UPI003B966AC5
MTEYYWDFTVEKASKILLPKYTKTCMFLKIYTFDELQVINPMDFRQVVSELNKIDI